MGNQSRPSPASHTPSLSYGLRSPLIWPQDRRGQMGEQLHQAVVIREKTEQELEEEKTKCADIRFKYQQQQKALHRSVCSLRAVSRDLTDVRGFLRTLSETWLALSCQLQQQFAQVLTGVRRDLAHSTDELQKATSEQERLTLRLIKQMNQSEEQLARQKISETDYKATIHRVKSELERTHEEWLSSQRRCETLEEQLSTWQQRLEQSREKYHTAEEDLTRLQAALERSEREVQEVRRDRSELLYVRHA
uniref:Uncharacterized protein n=1 Tax=Knipowitschia caucasica TaxID=637954 RepID=A0AAV2J2L3_KNICA